MIDDVTAVLEEIFHQATNDSLFVIHTGTNDIMTPRSEELLDKYRRLIPQDFDFTSSTTDVGGGRLF